MRRLFMLCLVLLLSTAGMAQVRVPNTRVTFEFPNSDWKYLDTKNIDKHHTMYLYTYNGKLFTDKTGEKEPPFMLIHVCKNYSKSVYEYAYDRYLQQPYQSINEYSDGLPTDEGLGYLGAYTSPTDENDYKFQMIYFKDRNTMYEFRLETHIENFDAMRDEFEQILKTVKID